MMDESQLDIRALFGVLRRQLRLIVGVVVAILAIAAFAVYSLKPVYTATALVLVDPQQRDILDPSNSDPAASTANARVDSEVELAKAPTVMLRVVEEAKLLEDPEFAPSPGLLARVMSFLRLRDYAPPTGDELLQSTLDKVKNAVSVRRQGLTYLIAVQAQSGVPATAARLANAVANAYIAEQLDAKIDATLKARELIRARLADASASVAALEDAVDRFIEDNIDVIVEQTGRTDLRELYAQKAAADRSRASLIALIDTADEGLRRRDWSELTRSLQSEAVKQLEARRQEVEESLQVAAMGSEAALDLRAELAKVETDLQAAAQSELSGLRTQVTSEQGRLSDLTAQLRSDVLSADLPATTLTKFYELQQTAEIARTQYQTLLTRSTELDQEASLQQANSILQSEALAPDAPSFPNPRLILTLAGVGALGLGIGLAFLYENLIGGVVSAEQLQALVKARRVHTIPRQKDQRGSLSLADILVRSPLSVFSEAIRKVRLSVEQSIRRSGPSSSEEGCGHVVLVTSAAPNEGKTTTSLALARAYAQSGATTLIVDCDLRKPSVHRQLGWEPSTGLIDYLNGERKAEAPALLSIVRVDDKSGIGVLVGSRRSDVATDALIAGATFGRLIDAARRSFDVVILDTPPVEPVVDGVYLAQFADAVVFVVKWASTSQPEVRRAVAAISEGIRPGVETIMVLNQSAENRRGYSGKYGYYYSEA